MASRRVSFRFSSLFTSFLCISSSFGHPLLDPILDPLGETVSSTLSGQGLIQGALGEIEGVLGAEQSYDYVVVGGGTAGNAIGVRLAEAGFTVAIIEAGINYELGKPVLGSTPAGAFFGIGSSSIDSLPTVDWEFVTEPQTGANNRSVHYARGKCLGGSSALNFMIHHRGSTGSYQQWADLVGDQSYTLENWLPYFEKAVNFTPPNNDIRRANVSTQYNADAFSSPGGPVQVGYTNWVSVWSTWLEKGLQAVGIQRTTGFDDGDLMGYHYSQSTIRASDQTRSSSAEYVYSVTGTSTEKNLKVYTETLAKKILFDGNKATGVQVSLIGAAPTYTIKATKEVIVSAGTFQSPQLLMVSGVGPKSTLEELDIPVVSNLEGVGQNMWDHILFGPSYQVDFPTLDATLHDPVALAAALVEYSTEAKGPLSSNVVEFLGWEKLPSKYRANFTDATREALSWFADDWPEVEHISGNGYIGDFAFPVLQQPLDGKQYATNLGAMVAPLSRGTVTITSSSMLTPPSINPNWLTHPADQEVAIAWYRRMREVWDTPELRSIRVGTSEAYPGLDATTDEQILDVVRSSLMTVWHAAGTCKMGQADDSMAVVDNAARVFGVENLRVVDASAFPLLPPGHPQSTVYALAEKIADSIITGEA
ncbi:alcohol oxidase [Xylariaceae sp. FL1272]|nr:alcohol oxidase [Xylariaceae sp. FL1272]